MGPIGILFRKIKRVRQLCDEFWMEIIRHGSIVHNFEDTPASAWEMVDAVLACECRLANEAE